MIEAHEQFCTDFIDAMNSRTAEVPDGWSREALVGLLRKAEGDYKEAVKAYDKAHSAENDAFWEHNQASYRKGIMDAYRSLLRRPEKPDSAG